MTTTQPTNYTSLLTNWKPDKTSDIPLCKQISGYILSLVKSGELPIGTLLPPQRLLSKLFCVNRSTLVTALEELLSLGIIETAYGAGTKIASNTWSLRMSTPTPNWGSYLHAGAFKENLTNIQTINKLEFKDEIIRLGTGELSPSLYPKEFMTYALQQASQKMTSLNYIEPLGLYELRKAVADFLLMDGIQVSPENVLITSGSLQALHLISIALLKKGDVCFTEVPSYLKSLQVFSSAGIALQGIPMDRSGIQYWEMTSYLSEKTSPILYTIPTFQNPTGLVTSTERRKELLHFCENHQLPIIEDDAYRLLWLDSPPPKPLKSLDQHGNVLYLGTASKTFAPGLRIGWLVGPTAILDRLADAKMQLDYGASSVSQWIFAELLQSVDKTDYLNHLRAELKKRRDFMVTLLYKYFTDIAQFEIPKGGFYIWLTFKKPINVNKLFTKALNHNILLNIGTLYGSTSSSLRLSFAYAKPEEMETGLQMLRKLLNQ